MLTGSIFAKVPTALIEMVNFDDKHDAAFIGTKAGRSKVAFALAAAIDAYVRSHQFP